VTGKDILRWSDDAMYEAQAMRRAEGSRQIVPQVFMLSGTPDPLGNLAADMRMYRGDPVYSLTEITNDERRWAWEELMKTHLNTPLEGVQVKFMIECVTRSFTHQMVRQRLGAYYVQESLRFAVKRGLAKEAALPPSIIPGPAADEPAFVIYTDAIRAAEKAYNALIDAGIPAEDARYLLPHATTTRIIYTTNLRALFEAAGNRLCTQAQFEWRAVFLGMMKAIQKYRTIGHPAPDSLVDFWQWELIASPGVRSFTPICYRLGRCAFMSELDRGCSIRDRVQEFARLGISSDEWHLDREATVGPAHLGVKGPTYRGIDPAEWLASPTAGVTTKEQPRPQ
jgi:flavin-dependent thymidylate synthase